MEKQPSRDKHETTRRAKRPLSPTPHAPTPARDDEEEAAESPRIGEVPRTRTEMPPRLSESPG